MGTGATECEVLEKKLEKRLQDPKTEPLVSLPLYFLKDITSGFSTEREIGRGACGIVYKGVLRSSKAIAVKRIFDTHLLGNDNQVKNEIIFLTEVRHQNVVQLLGYCVETKSELVEYRGKHVMAENRACLLCFEFLCNGSLDEHLSDKTSVLDWDKRYKIIRAICRGLHYLHDECHIVHLDLKPQNILMDATRMPKIADFGLSRLLGEQKSKIVTANRAGTPGYMAQEYLEHGIISSKADIFSLGVIIIEIITGCRDYPNIGERTETSLKHYTDKVVGSWRNRTPMHMSPEMHIQQVEKCISIALMCMEPESKKRPTSLDIVQGLDALEPESGCPANSPSDPEEVVGSWRNRLVELTPMHMSPEMCIQQVQQCISIALKFLEPELNKRPTSLDIVQSLNTIEPKCTSPGNPPSVIEKDMGNQIFHSQVNMNMLNIPKTISAVNGLNECANLFQWVTSAISSLKSQSNETQKERLQRDICQLHSDLQCLTDTLPAIDNLIERAEWRIHHDSVADLLSRLKDAMYDAEDILDEFRWYETKLSVEGNAISVEPIIDFFHSVTQGSFNKVTDIQKRLNLLSEQLKKMGLLQAVPQFDKSFRPETTAFPTEPKIFGRVEEKNKLIRLLGVPTYNNAGPSGHKRKRSGMCSSTGKQICATIDTNEATVTSVPVLPIVGIGGVGKTTLAQDICNNSKVICHFKLIIWICVSDDFDVKRLTKEAIEQSSGEVPKNDNLNSLQGALANSLKTRRFLLVLDDMWNENELDWKRFFAPFRNVVQGSMMLVTTRSPKVADVVRTMDPFPLEGLNKHVIWEFFKLCVFGSNSSNIDPELERIGEKILPKLRGSPLAAKTLGRLLRRKLDPLHWEGILNSQLWEHRQEGTDILPALRLSYIYLPFYLKRCFSFCGIYPKDYNFGKEELVEIWVAEGFVKHQPYVSLQHTGGQYFEELAYLSFFQKHPWLHKKYVIHDLMHDMAQLVSKDECSVIKDKKDFPRIPQNVRHLWVLKGGDFKCSDLLNLCKHRKLHTLLCDLSLESKTCYTVMEKWCTELLCMRVVCFSISTERGIPDSISNMKLLRYLKILNSTQCKRLPSAICYLYNMQIFYAKNWEIDYIPSGFGKLLNLQKFESVNCQLSMTDAEITDCRNLTNFEEFRQLAYVPTIKKIKISSCRSLESVPTERFRDLPFLEVLNVSHCPKIKSRHLLAPSLKKLYLEDSGNLGYKIECSSLIVLHLSHYPPESIELQLWSLPLLQELKISSCPSLTITIDSEPISSDILNGEARSRAIGNTFRFLTVVQIRNCQNLSSLEQFLQPPYVPTIKNIEISHCPNLESVPTNKFGYFRFLEVLSVSHCPKIKSQHLFAPSLKKLYLENSGNLGYNIECSSLTILQLSYYPLESIELQMWNLPLLVDLLITFCSSLTIIRDSEPSTNLFNGGAQSRMEKFPLLADLTITSCEKLKTIDDLLYLPAVQTIWITNCGLLSLAAHRLESFPRLKDFKISTCQSLNWQSGMLLPCSLQNLRLWSCGDFSAWFPSCLEKLTSLEWLDIRDCECIVSVPGHLWSNLKSLQRLDLSNCPKLKSVGGPNAIAHIRGLFIGDCPELKEIDQPMRREAYLLA